MATTRRTAITYQDKEYPDARDHPIGRRFCDTTVANDYLVEEYLSNYISKLDSRRFLALNSRAATTGGRSGGRQRRTRHAAWAARLHHVGGDFVRQPEMELRQRISDLPFARGGEEWAYVEAVHDEIVGIVQKGERPYRGYLDVPLDALPTLNLFQGVREAFRWCRDYDTEYRTRWMYTNERSGLFVGWHCVEFWDVTPGHWDRLYANVDDGVVWRKDFECPRALSVPSPWVTQYFGAALCDNDMSSYYGGRRQITEGDRQVREQLMHRAKAEFSYFAFCRFVSCVLSGGGWNGVRDSMTTCTLHDFPGMLCPLAAGVKAFVEHHGIVTLLEGSGVSAAVVQMAYDRSGLIDWNSVSKCFGDTGPFFRYNAMTGEIADMLRHEWCDDEYKMLPPAAVSFRIRSGRPVVRSVDDLDRLEAYERRLTEEHGAEVVEHTFRYEPAGEDLVRRTTALPLNPRKHDYDIAPYEGMFDPRCQGGRGIYRVPNKRRASGGQGGRSSKFKRPAGSRSVSPERSPSPRGNEPPPETVEERVRREVTEEHVASVVVPLREALARTTGILEDRTTTEDAVPDLGSVAVFCQDLLQTVVDYRKQNRRYRHERETARQERTQAVSDRDKAVKERDDNVKEANDQKKKYQDAVVSRERDTTRYQGYWQTATTERDEARQARDKLRIELEAMRKGRDELQARVTTLEEEAGNMTTRVTTAEETAEAATAERDEAVGRLDNVMDGSRAYVRHLAGTVRDAAEAARAVMATLATRLDADEAVDELDKVYAAIEDAGTAVNPADGGVGGGGGDAGNGGAGAAA